MSLTKLLIPAILGISACVSTEYVKEIVTNQAGFDFDCDHGEIKIFELGRSRYVAEGCFRKEIYTCEEGYFSQDVHCTQKKASEDSDE